MNTKNSGLLVKNGPKGFIESLSPVRRQELDKELVAAVKSRRQIALELGCSQSTVEKYYVKSLMPRIRIAKSSIDDQRRRDARANLAWLFEDLRDGLKMAKENKDAKAMGPLINAGNNLVRTQAELEGELKGGAAAAPQVNIEVVRVLSMPKISDQLAGGPPPIQVIDARPLPPSPPQIEGPEEEA